jgi:predicted GNAT superfamily acetyltransferase
VRTYLLYVHDERYSVPTLDTIVVADDERAREVAAARLIASQHHRSVEVWDEARLVCGIDRPRPTPG